MQNISLDISPKIYKRIKYHKMLNIINLWERQIETTMAYNFIYNRMVSVKKQDSHRLWYESKMIRILF